MRSILRRSTTRTPVIAAASAALILALSGANADHCETWTTSTTGFDQVVLDAGVFYVANDVCQLECVFSMWFYEETNGLPGLQRGDTRVDDTCHGMIESDSIVY